MNNLDSSKDYIIAAYEEGKSTSELAKELNTHAQSITRILKKYGVKLRTKTEAQQLLLKEGKHPSKGKKRDSQTKDKISKGMKETWERAPESKRYLYAERTRYNWENMNEFERDQMKILWSDNLQKASKEGSKPELYLYKELTRLGYQVVFHKKCAIENGELEVDMLVPGSNIAIEIDGISHFEPVWGQEKFEKQIRADAEKSGLLLKAGYNVLRVKYVAKAFLRHVMNSLVEQVVQSIKDLETKTSTFVEVEVK